MRCLSMLLMRAGKGLGPHVRAIHLSLVGSDMLRALAEEDRRTPYRCLPSKKNVHPKTASINSVIIARLTKMMTNALFWPFG